MPIAVNIPPDHFYEPGFVDRVLGTLEEHHLAPERLTLELTEESILADGVIRIAHGFGLEVVAEGVEHEAQRALLQEFGCDVVQGYLFSRPVLPDDAIALLKRWRQVC